MHRCPRCGLDKWDDHKSRPEKMIPDEDEWKCLVCSAVMCSNQVISKVDAVEGDWPILSHENFQGEAKGTMQQIGGEVKKIYVCGPVVHISNWKSLDEETRLRIVAETKLIDLIEKNPLVKPAVIGKSLEHEESHSREQDQT